MGVDPAHGAQVHLRSQEQGLVHGQQDLRADAQRAVEEGVQRGIHRALGGVLHGYHAVVGAAPLHGLEDGLDGALGQGLAGAAELVARGEVGEGPLGPQEGHAQRLLQAEAGAHDFLEDRAHRRIREGAAVLALEPGEDLPFALGRVEEGFRRGGSFQLPHLGRQARPPVEQGQYLVVHGIDGPAEVVKGLGIAWGHEELLECKNPRAVRSRGRWSGGVNLAAAYPRTQGAKAKGEEAAGGQHGGEATVPEVRRDRKSPECSEEPLGTFKVSTG